MTDGLLLPCSLVPPRRCSPCVGKLHGDDEVERLIVDYCRDDGEGYAYGRAFAGSFSASDVYLDLRDATGRAHAAWWLWRCHGGRAECAGASWWMTSMNGPPHWRLSHPMGRPGDDGHDSGGIVAWSGCAHWPPHVPMHNSLVTVPSLADLDPDDPRLLDDNSRWVDAEALRRVCLHVATTTPGADPARRTE